MTAADRTKLRDKVRIAYSAAAEMPQDKHAFPVGHAFAESLGYAADLLDQLPAVASDAFAGVSNVSIFAEIPSGATILDLGCGAGLDALIAARRVGLSGKSLSTSARRCWTGRVKQSQRPEQVTSNCAKRVRNNCPSPTKRSTLPWSTGSSI